MPDEILLNSGIITKSLINMAAKKTAKNSGTKKTGAKKGTKYACSTCGIVVTVDQACGCVDVCDLICCGEQMEVKE